MDLLNYLNALRQVDRDRFVAACATSEGYLRKAVSVGQRFRPALCVAIERESGGRVTRRELRQEDWHEIWPELISDREKAAA